MGKSLKLNRNRLGRKAQYDLGRKAIYFTVAIIVIAMIFVYLSNTIGSYQIESLKYMPKVMDLAHVTGIEKCISEEKDGRVYPGRLREDLDIDSVKKCLERDELLREQDFRIRVEGKPAISTTDDPFEHESYERYFFSKNKLEKVIIEVEKSELSL